MKVSIITVAYNSAETIADTIESVLSQTYRDIDYWIIDGVSKDNTIDIVKEYEAKSEGRLHWISEKDKGIYDAMNKGIAHCTGDVIGILNSDDFFTSHDVIRKEIFEQYGVYDPNYKISADYELIARFCHIHKIKRKYIHLDFVTMRIGGASTKNIKARILGTEEDLIACKKLGIYSNKFMIYCKYFIKSIESLLIRK